MTCETLYCNATIYTMDKTVSKAQWLAVERGRIIARGMGTPPPFDAKNTVDLTGKVMLPGLIDSHMHGTNTGAFLNDLNVNAADSVEGVLEMVREAARSGGDDWIIASGLSMDGLKEKRQPTRWELDKVSGKHPVYLKNVTLHGSCVNSIAFDMIDVPAELPGIAKNEQGEATGEYNSDESAFYAAQKINSMQPDSVVEKYIQDACQHCVSRGTTTISGLDGILFDATDRDFFMWLNKKDELPLHVVNFFQNESIHLAKALGLPRVGGCLCLDGAGFESTMATRSPYNQSATPSGVLYWDDERLYRFLMEGNRNGMQTALHALGDRSIDQYLRVYERVYRELGLEGNPFHARIEHFSLVWPEQIEKAVSMGLVLSMQPMFAYIWDDDATVLGQSYRNMLGEERAARMEPFREILDAGGLIAGGSDSPVTLHDPLGGIHALCNMPMEYRRLNVTDAIRAFTINGAYANRQETEKGSIAVGKLADLVVLDRDPYKEPESIKDFKVLQTIVEGKTVYSHE